MKQIWEKWGLMETNEDTWGHIGKHGDIWR